MTDQPEAPMSEERLLDLETLYEKFYCDYCTSHTEMLEALTEIRRLRAKSFDSCVKAPELPITVRASV